jgi:hypothetical protein
VCTVLGKRHDVKTLFSEMPDLRRYLVANMCKTIRQLVVHIDKKQSQVGEANAFREYCDDITSALGGISNYLADTPKDQVTGEDIDLIIDLVPILRRFEKGWFCYDFLPSYGLPRGYLSNLTANEDWCKKLLVKNFPAFDELIKSIPALTKNFDFGILLYALMNISATKEGRE